MNISKYRNDKNIPYYLCINVSDKINLFTTDRLNPISIFKPTLFEPFEGKTNIRNIVTLVEIPWYPRITKLQNKMNSHPTYKT